MMINNYYNIIKSLNEFRKIPRAPDEKLRPPKKLGCKKRTGRRKDK